MAIGIMSLIGMLGSAQGSTSTMVITLNSENFEHLTQASSGNYLQKTRLLVLSMEWALKSFSLSCAPQE